MEDPAILMSESLSEIVRSIADKVSCHPAVVTMQTFPIFIDHLKNVDNDRIREEILQSETCAMMLRYCSVSVVARKVAGNYGNNLY